MKFTPIYFYKNTPKEKWKAETITCKLIYRPLSFLVSSVFAFFHISANTTSFISFIISIVATALLFFNNSLLTIISVVLFNIWLLLDCVDGNLARCVKKMKYGDFLDAISYYVFVGPYLFGLTYFSFLNGGLIFDSFDNRLLLIGGLGAVLYILSLLFRKKFEENSSLYLDKKNLNGTNDNNIIFKLITELSGGGFMPLIFLLGAIFNFLDACVLFYSIFNFAAFISCSALYCFKSFLANRSK